MIGRKESDQYGVSGNADGTVPCRGPGAFCVALAHRLCPVAARVKIVRASGCENLDGGTGRVLCAVTNFFDRAAAQRVIENHKWIVWHTHHTCDVLCGDLKRFRTQNNGSFTELLESDAVVQTAR